MNSEPNFSCQKRRLSLLNLPLTNKIVRYNFRGEAVGREMHKGISVDMGMVVSS